MLFRKGRIRSNTANGMTIDDAVDKAVDDRPKTYEIKSFLMANRAEVKAMCITEYNEAETMQMFKEEGREEGLVKGREEGLVKGREEGREEGVRGIVEVCKSFGGTSIDAVEKIVATMGFSEAEADHLVKKFW